MSDQIFKKMPISLEAEMGVLGSVLIDPAKFADITSIITSEDFYSEENKNIFQAMQSLFLQSKTIDHVTLMDELIHQGTFDQESSKTYIRTILDSVAVSSNIVDYAKIVADKSILRKLINAASEISGISYEAKDDVETILDAAEQKIYNIADGNAPKNFEHIKDILVSTYDDLKKLNNDKDAGIGVPTGFSDLDRLIVGLGKMDLVIIGARPGMGKTALAMNIATNVAKNTKKAVCTFTLEMSNEQVVTRILSSEALVDSYKLRSGTLDADDWKELAHAASRLNDCEMYFDDTTNITITSMKSKLRRMKNLGLVVVDYLGLMQGEKNTDNRALEVADISRNLKKMAKEFEVPVIACAQLNRESASKDRRPALHDLRESGGIEQDADIVMFVHRKEDFDAESGDNPNQAEIIVAKNRHGAPGVVKMNFLGKYTKFTSCEQKSSEE